jgi:hypothetical protein
MNKYAVEIVWNREFNWTWWKSYSSIEEAKSAANDALDMGDGARVKKARVIDCETGKVVC